MQHDQEPMAKLLCRSGCRLKAITAAASGEPSDETAPPVNLKEAFYSSQPSSLNVSRPGITTNWGLGFLPRKIAFPCYTTLEPFQRVVKGLPIHRLEKGHAIAVILVSLGLHRCAATANAMLTALLT